MKLSRKAAIAGVVLLPVIGGGFLLQSRSAVRGSQLLDQVLTLVSDRFVDTLATSELYEKAARGLVKQLNDPYSELFSPKELKQFNTSTGGKYGGIGMQIEPQNNQIVISTVFPNTPAENAGVREGDHIIGVDSIDTRGWTTQQMSDYLTGTPGTKVTVRFARPGVATPLVVNFTRAVIRIPAVNFAIMFDDKIGYLPVQRFNETSAEEVAEAVQRLSNEGAKGIVLDMRGNPGGILDQSLAMANLFLQPGQEIATVRARNGESQDFRARGKPLLPTTPVVVLTDGSTASAAEIVSGALQDHDRALVVGQPTWGKGLVQSVFNLDGGYALKLTTAKWYTPSGRSIQKERKYENGHFVEEKPDTAPMTEAQKKARPAYKSDAGRIVYGGGGITPDVLVQEDTLTVAEQAFNKAIAPKSQEVYVALYDYALDLSKNVPKNFTVQQSWLDEFYKRIKASGVDLDKPQYDAARRYVSRVLEQRIARFAFGDSTAKRRDLPYDAPLRTALDLLEKGNSQKDLFALAAAERTAAAPSTSPTVVRKP
jgi:carboxyl-terminal processing protease